MNSIPDFPSIRSFAGIDSLPPGRFAIIVSQFNQAITQGLLRGAVETLLQAGVAESDIDVFWVPGAFEIPTVAAELARFRQHLAVLCLGAVIKGETTHDEHINRAVSLQLAEIGVQTGVPVLFGLLTCQTLEQAVARSAPLAAVRDKSSGKKAGNKGAECAQAALEMVRLLCQLREIVGPSQGGASLPSQGTPSQAMSDEED